MSIIRACGVLAALAIAGPALAQTAAQGSAAASSSQDGVPAPASPGGFGNYGPNAAYGPSNNGDTGATGTFRYGTPSPLLENDPTNGKANSSVGSDKSPNTDSRPDATRSGDARDQPGG